MASLACRTLSSMFLTLLDISSMKALAFSALSTLLSWRCLELYTEPSRSFLASIDRFDRFLFIRFELSIDLCDTTLLFSAYTALPELGFILSCTSMEAFESCRFLIWSTELFRDMRELFLLLSALESSRLLISETGSFLYRFGRTLRSEEGRLRAYFIYLFAISPTLGELITLGISMGLSIFL